LRRVSKRKMARQITELQFVEFVVDAVKMHNPHLSNSEVCRLIVDYCINSHGPTALDVWHPIANVIWNNIGKLNAPEKLN
jgi:hypothetical protein